MIILSACSGLDAAQIKNLSKEDMSKIAEATIACNDPYIRFETGCCLDQNKNNICDKDESNNAPTEKVSTITTKYDIVRKSDLSSDCKETWTSLGQKSSYVNLGGETKQYNFATVRTSTYNMVNLENKAEFGFEITEIDGTSNTIQLHFIPGSQYGGMELVLSEPKSHDIDGDGTDDFTVTLTNINYNDAGTPNCDYKDKYSVVLKFEVISQQTSQALATPAQSQENQKVYLRCATNCDRGIEITTQYIIDGEAGYSQNYKLGIENQNSQCPMFCSVSGGTNYNYFTQGDRENMLVFSQTKMSRPANILTNDPSSLQLICSEVANTAGCDQTIKQIFNTK